jgi:hypothetical protein
LADRRRLADSLALPAECEHEACRRSGRCRGPRGGASAFPGAVLPACLADGFEEMFEPVARWAALWDRVAEVGESLAAPEAAPPRGGRPARRA